MAYKINISDLALSQLNAACLTQISKFAVALEQLDGRVLELRGKDLMQEVVQIAKSTDDVVLQTLYHGLKQEIKKHINSPKFIKLNPQVSSVDMQSSDFDKLDPDKHKKH